MAIGSMFLTDIHNSLLNTGPYLNGDYGGSEGQLKAPS